MDPRFLWLIKIKKVTRLIAPVAGAIAFLMLISGVIALSLNAAF